MKKREKRKNSLQVVDGGREQEERRREENVRAFQATFGEEAERTIPNRITVHNWPYGKPNTIFSVGDEPIITENIFAVTVKGVSYLGSIDNFNMEYLVKTDEFEQEIPLGVTTLDLYERICVMEEGSRIWENPSQIHLEELSKEEKEQRKLELYTVPQEEHYAIFLPERAFDGKFCVFMGSLQYPEYFHVRSNVLEEVCTLAEQFSKAHKMPCLVAKRVYSCNWH